MIQSGATGDLSRAGTTEKIKLLPKSLPESEREGGREIFQLPLPLAFLPPAKCSLQSEAPRMKDSLLRDRK